MKAFVKMMRKNVGFTIGLIIILVLLLTAAFANVIAPFDYAERAGENLQSPGAKYLFGTDGNGRDLFSRIVYGSRLALKTAFITSFISVFLGLFFGLTSGYYYGSKWDGFVQFIINILMSIPAIILAVGIVSVLGKTLNNVIIAFAIISWTGTARIIRAKTQAILNQPYVEAGKAFGERDINIILHYILPNIATTLIVMITMSLPGTLLATATLSFLNLGAQPPLPDWGAILSGGMSYIYIAPWLTVIPGLVITTIAVGINMFGEGLRDLLDVNTK